VPHDISIFIRNRSKLILFGLNKKSLNNFVYKCKSLKPFDFYKGKGVTFFKNKSFFKLKKGKQQQF
jgi:ribosomal protein L6P/L9E